MPNRIIKESITTSATLAQLSAEEERFFIRLTVVVDDYGRIDGRPCILRAKCFGAMLERVTEKHVARWLDALIRVGLVTPYEHDSRCYLFISKWDTHQRIRAKASKCPEPLEADRIRGHMTADDSTCPRMTADDSICRRIRDPGSEIREARSESRAPRGTRRLPPTELLTDDRIRLGKEHGLDEATIRLEWRKLELTDFPGTRSDWTRVWRKWLLSVRRPGARDGGARVVPSVEATRRMLAERGY